MVESTTLNYHWTKPEITKSPSTWGKFLNDDLDAIDGLVFANQQAIVPIGAMTMYGGATAPANWLICDGRTLDYGVTPAYQALFNVIGRAFNPALSGTQFALPNLQQKFPLGVNTFNPLGQSGGNFSVSIAIGNMPAHNHPASQDAHVHAAWQDSHAHTVGNTQAHSHVIVTGNHSHVLTVNPHNHNVGTVDPNQVGSGVAAGSGWKFGNPVTSTAGNFSGSTDVAGNLGGNTDSQVLAVGNTDARTPGVYTDNRQPNVYTGNTGSGAAFNVVPPFVAVNFIIRYQ